MLPLQNLIEVVSLRVLDAESLYSLVVSLSHVVSDVLVVVLSCTCVDVDYEAVKALGIENPEAYDFNKILEW